MSDHFRATMTLRFKRKNKRFILEQLFIDDGARRGRWQEVPLVDEDAPQEFEFKNAKVDPPAPAS